MDSLQNPNPERHRRSHDSNVRPKIGPLGLSPKKIGEDIAGVLNIMAWVGSVYDFACSVCLGEDKGLRQLRLRMGVGEVGIGGQLLGLGVELVMAAEFSQDSCCGLGWVGL
ncbi:Hypothetical predicted protein [Prunus dulcis]|uniref:Uncharacterized protein n=1 Tax=Prunus dulcis TaxID=3755 RepID=A0A5E4FQR8_PRUDU|nr:hypothetical protein L3X38_018819 [Prunus dulcis]VVA29831.1 Hypothetical predicted protein [Prunus dulcis]